MTSTAVPNLTEAQQTQLDHLTREFSLETSTLKVLHNRISEAMERGLAEYNSHVPMIPSYVVKRPTGQETGTYLAMDLGGTNLRVCSVRLLGGGKVTVRQRKFTIPDTKKVGPGRLLFDYLAECALIFFNEVLQPEIDSETAKVEYALGFTFSFPLEQTAIDCGTIMRWNKGFDMPDSIHKDAVQLLQSALTRHNLPIRVTAVVNDTVGCLLTGAYRDPAAQVGVIFGTGTNAAYYERINQITKWTKQHNSADDPLIRDATEMIINIEWGAFDIERRSLPRTMFDARIDRTSQEPFSQQFEKMISGMYLGEIVRQVVLDLIDRRLLFDGRSSSELNQPYTFDTAYLSEIEADKTPQLEGTRRVLEDVLVMPNGSTTLTDRYLVRRICILVGTRAARLGAASLAAALSRRRELLDGEGKRVAVGIDGSLFEHYPGFSDRLMAGLEEILDLDQIRNKITLMLSKDGSGVGAALAAMLSTKNVLPK